MYLLYARLAVQAWVNAVGAAVLRTWFQTAHACAEDLVKVVAAPVLPDQLIQELHTVISGPLPIRIVLI